MTIHFEYDLDAEDDRMAVARIEELLRSPAIAVSTAHTSKAIWNTIERLGDAAD
jgi:hypothetical protein